MDDDKTGRLSKQVGLLSLFKSEVLGKGCNGTVFRGHFLSTIDVAIKRVDKSFIRVESNLLLKAALHPNIIRYYATEDDHIEFL
jgi:serine/threonine protein kinase